MGLFDFVKNAGRSLGMFGGDEDEKPKTADSPAVETQLSDEQIAVGLKRKLDKLALNIQHLTVSFAAGTATVRGVTESQADREKVVMAAGNTPIVEKVEEFITVEPPVSEAEAAPEPECTWHTVKSGDTLSAVSQAAYGDPNLYNDIFEANKPMLSDPNLIYPGQVLRIPPRGGAPAGRQYTVQPGDTLGGIAASCYGNPGEYNRIFEANRDKLANPNAVAVGQVLNIPDIA